MELPPFFKADPRIWFFQVEARFRLDKITQDQMKYDIVVYSINMPDVLTQIADILMNPPISGKYDAIKKRLSPTIESYTNCSMQQTAKLQTKIPQLDLPPIATQPLNNDDVMLAEIKDPDSTEMEELSEDAFIQAADSSLRQDSCSSPICLHSSESLPSSKNNTTAIQHPSVSNAHVEESPPDDENGFAMEPSELLKPALTANNVPSISNVASYEHLNLPSSSVTEESQIHLYDNQALVLDFEASEFLDSSHLQDPDKPCDIKLETFTFDNPFSLVTNPSLQSYDSMTYMDQSSMCGPSFQDEHSSRVIHPGMDMTAITVSLTFDGIGNNQDNRYANAPRHRHHQQQQHQKQQHQEQRAKGMPRKLHAKRMQMAQRAERMHKAQHAKGMPRKLHAKRMQIARCTKRPMMPMQNKQLPKRSFIIPSNCANGHIGHMTPQHKEEFRFFNQMICQHLQHLLQQQVQQTKRRLKPPW